MFRTTTRAHTGAELSARRATTLMPLIESRPGPFSDRGSAAVIIVAICLSVAGLVAAFLVRHQDEKVAAHTQPAGRTSLFEPGVKALEVISKISEPREPLWAKGNVEHAAAGDSTGTGRVTAASPSTDTQLPNPGRESYTPLSASVTVAPESTAWVPVISFAPVSEVPGVSANVPLTPLPQAPTGPAQSATPTASFNAPNDAGAPSAPASPSAPAERYTAQPPTVQCGSVKCAPGLVCCNASCGTCARPGEKCSQQVCGMSTVPTSTPCGLSTCNVGEFCCNPYCGICATSPADCDSNASCMSPVQYPQSVSCGMVTCNTGYVCCNPSCGICAPYGEACSQDTCG